MVVVKQLQLALLTGLLVLCVSAEPGPAEQESRTFKDGPDFSNVAPAPALISKMGINEASALRELKRFSPKVHGEILEANKRTDDPLARVSNYLKTMYRLQKTADVTELNYKNGAIEKDALFENMQTSDHWKRVSDAFAADVFLAVLSQPGEGDQKETPEGKHLQEILKIINTWQDEAAGKRKRNRERMGLHENVGETPGAEEKLRMLDVCSYVKQGPAAGWESIKQACYAYWEMFHCTQVRPHQRVVKCREALTMAKQKKRAGGAIWDFCKFAPEGQQDSCYKFAQHVQTICHDFQAYDHEKARKCQSAVSAMPKDARL